MDFLQTTAAVSLSCLAGRSVLCPPMQGFPTGMKPIATLIAVHHKPHAMIWNSGFPGGTRIVTYFLVASRRSNVKAVSERVQPFEVGTRMTGRE